MFIREGSGFSRDELRTIRQVTQDPGALTAVAGSLFSLKRLVGRNAHLAWDDFATASKPFSQLLPSQKQLVEEGFRRFASAREAADFWKIQLRKKREETEDTIRHELDIPEHLRIFRIRFTRDYGIVLMPLVHVNEYYDYRLQRDGFAPLQRFSVDGFMGPDLFLEDPLGNRCSMMIVEGDWANQDEVEQHEAEHIVFDRYFRRVPYEKAVPQEIDAGKRATQYWSNIIGSEANPIAVAERVKEYIGEELFAARESMFNEAVAEGAEGRYKGGKESQVDDYFIPVPLGKAESNHIYGHTLGQRIDVIIDAIMEGPLSREEKLQQWWEIEKTVGVFIFENHYITEWISTLSQKTKGQKNKLSSMLEVIPPSRPWVIGNFIGLDPKWMRERVFDKKEVRDAHWVRIQALWAMLIHFCHESMDKRKRPSFSMTEKQVRRFYEELQASVDGVPSLEMMPFNVASVYWEYRFASETKREKAI